MGDWERVGQFIISKMTPEAGVEVGTRVFLEQMGRDRVRLELQSIGSEEMTLVEGGYHGSRRVASGVWHDQRLFEVELKRNGEGPRCLHCTLRSSDHEPNSDSWTADEDGP